MSKTAARLSHLLLPVEVDTDKAEVVRALNALLEACGPSIPLGYEPVQLTEKNYFLRAFETHEAAVAARVGMASKFHVYEENLHSETVHDFQNKDAVMWVSIISPDDPTPPISLQRETFQYHEFVAELLERMETAQNVFLVEEFQRAISGQYERKTLKDFLLTLALGEIKQDIAVDLRHLPYSETVDLSDRGRYIKDAWGVNPVDAVQGDDIYAVANAVNEANEDNIASTEAQILREHSQERWDRDSEEWEPLMEVLGKGREDFVEELESWTRSITEFRGVLDYKPSGNVAVSAIPFIGKEAIFISFDGVTSSSVNGVVDENYLAMLDLLRVDIRSWVDHLLVRADLPKADWDIDVAAIVDRFRHHARIDPSTGIHWDSQALQEDMKIAIMDVLFPSPDEPSSAVEAFALTEEGQELEALNQKLAIRLDESGSRTHDVSTTRSILSDAEMDRFATLRSQYKEARDTDKGHEWRSKHREYVFDIALEVFKAQMDDLDTVWSTENGIDVGDLMAITSSKAAFEKYPQLAQHPDYSMALANLGNNCNAYEWKNPPHQTSSKPALISHKALTELMDNCMYDGNLVVAFECDLDDLQKIGQGMMEGNTPKEVKVSGGYVHIHNYTNGAGDGVELDGDWAFTTDDLRAKRLRLDNDTSDRYGIQDVFGEFLARRSSVRIADLVPVADIPDPVFYLHPTEGQEVIINTPRVTAWAKAGLAVVEARMAGSRVAGEVIPAVTQVVQQQLSELATGNTPIGTESIGRAEWDAIKMEVQPAATKVASRSFSGLDR